MSWRCQKRISWAEATLDSIDQEVADELPEEKAVEEVNVEEEPPAELQTKEPPAERKSADEPKAEAAAEISAEEELWAAARSYHEKRKMVQAMAAFKIWMCIVQGIRRYSLLKRPTKAEPDDYDELAWDSGPSSEPGNSRSFQ